MSKGDSTSEPRSAVILNSLTYVPTTYKTMEDLLPSELVKGKLDEFLLQKLKRNYEGRTIRDGDVEGFVRKGSLTLQERTRGFYKGAHFTGHITFGVQVHFSLYTPQVNTRVYATVQKATPFGFTAVAHPLRIVVAQNSTFQQVNDLFKQIKPGMRLPIEILHFEPRGDHFYTVGRLMEYSKEYEKTYQLSLGEFQFSNPSKDFKNLSPHSETQYVEAFNRLPSDEWRKMYGDPSDLNDAKKSLADPNDPWQVLYYEKFIKQLLNDYEIVGNNRYFNSNKIFQLDPVPCSRAYFKLTEILHDFDILKEIGDSGAPLEGLLLAEAPGGFVQALMDNRDNMNVRTSEDFYRAVTAPKNPKTGVRKDWTCNNKAATSFLASKADQLDLVLGDLTDPDFIRDLISKYTQDDLGDDESPEETGVNLKRKANIITADGGIDVATSDNYNYQEMMNYMLFYGEILTAIGCQEKGGHFVLKIYDAFTDVTNQLIQLMAQLWSEVFITKPKTSRPANSERYVVCKHFRGIGNFPLQDHLESLETWRTLEAESLEKTGLEPTSPFKDRQLFITSLVNIALDPDITNLLHEKNQIFVTRQMEAIQEGMSKMKELRNPNIPRDRKAKIITDRLAEQIQTAIRWCKEYLPDEKCRDYPSQAVNDKDLDYFFGKDQSLTLEDASTVDGTKTLKAIL